MSDNKITWVEEKETLLEGLSGKQLEVTSILLDNQKKALTETANTASTATGDMARFDKLVMPLIRRVTPATIAMELVGVQPMNGPVGMVRSLRVKYSNAKTSGGPTADQEASGVTVFEKYSKLAATDTVYTANDALDEAALTAKLENEAASEMSLDVIKKTITATSRKLRARWSVEADEDAKALDAIDLESELVAALSDEITREQDRELITELTNLAGTVLSFNFLNADGRYSGEKFTAITIGISDLSAKIAIACKRGGASWMVISNNVLTAIRHASNGSFVPASPSGDVNPSSTLFAGTYNGNVKVFVDFYAITDTILMGYKGSSELDTGFVYAPYVPLMKSGVVTDPETFDPSMGLRTRYAFAKFNEGGDADLGNSADYYGRATVSNLSLGGF